MKYSLYTQREFPAQIKNKELRWRMNVSRVTWRVSQRLLMITDLSSRIRYQTSDMRPRSSLLHPGSSTRSQESGGEARMSHPVIQTRREKAHHPLSTLKCQSEANIQVTWSLKTNQRVFRAEQIWGFDFVRNKTFSCQEDVFLLTTIQQYTYVCSIVYSP